MPDLNAMFNQIGVMTAVIAGAIILITVIIIFVVMRSLRPNRAVLQNGIPGQGTITRVWQTGTSLNDNPQIGMKLNVELPGQPPYEAEVKMIIPLINIPQFQPGAKVPVKVDPAKPQNVVLDIYG